MTFLIHQCLHLIAISRVHLQIAIRSIQLQVYIFIDNFLFICGQNNRGLFNGSADLLGLGRHLISFVEQTCQIYNKTFSYCLPSSFSDVGYLTFGAANNSGVKYTRFSTISNQSSFYGLDIVGINIGGIQIPFLSSIFSSGGASIDSGTSLRGDYHQLPMLASVIPSKKE
ncbi:hypothetical protein TSUD_129360 [Trifolium subterraneum]|uniref:Xylanase inhibitor N-terminal domain-containing protein n=1 Tax=Trifolium subterraneum TaxID=3900 RepID=A0A2Z6NN92_TRISU|nr:hypothetical protein TSUD_129360 [Trifolium subterraneum]